MKINRGRSIYESGLTWRAYGTLIFFSESKFKTYAAGYVKENLILTNESSKFRHNNERDFSAPSGLSSGFLLCNLKLTWKKRGR